MPCLHFSLPTATRTPPLPGPGRAALHPARAGRALAWALGLAGCLAGALPAAAAPSPGEADLVQRARAWLAAVHQLAPSAIAVQPLDARLQVGTCAGGWSFDKPFPQNEGVLRARCADTQWQLFLSVALPRPAAAAVPASLASPAAATAMPAAPQAPAAAVPAVQATQFAQPGQNGQALPVSFSPPAAAAAGQAAPLVVRRGHTVLTTWSPVPGLEVSARLESLDDGRVGDTIRVRNRDTGRILGALVSGQNQATGQ